MYFGVSSGSINARGRACRWVRGLTCNRMYFGVSSGSINGGGGGLVGG